MTKLTIALLIIAIMVASGLVGIYVYSANNYNTWNLDVLPVYDFTISIREGTKIFNTIGNSVNWMNGIVDFKPTELVKVNYRKTHNNTTTDTFIIIYAPLNEDFNNLSWNRYYRIYAYNSSDENLHEIITQGYNYICPYYRDMTSQWWWIANFHNNQEYNKLTFNYAGITDGTGIEPDNTFTYEFISTQVITSGEMAHLKLNYS